MYNIVKDEVKEEVKKEVEVEVKSEDVSRNRRRMETILVTRPETLLTKKGQYTILMCYAMYSMQ